jgi:hypothetical protein
MTSKSNAEKMDVAAECAGQAVQSVTTGAGVRFINILALTVRLLSGQANTYYAR